MAEDAILTIRSLGGVRSTRGLLEGLDAIGEGRVEIVDAGGKAHVLTRAQLLDSEIVPAPDGWLWITQASEAGPIFHEGAEGIQHIGTCIRETSAFGSVTLRLDLDRFANEETYRPLSERLESGAWKNVGCLHLKGSAIDDFLETFRGPAGFWLLSIEGTPISVDPERFVGFRRHLEWLWLRDCRIDAERFGRLRRLTWLKHLELVRVELAEQELACLAALPKLEVLELEGAWIGDVGVAHAGRCSGLVELRVASERLGSDGVRALAGLSLLRKLELEGPGVSDDAIPFLLQLRELEHLDLSRTAVSPVGDMCVRRHLPELETFRARREPVVVDLGGVA